MVNTLDWYARAMGPLVVNLQSLEFSIRTRLCHDDGGDMLPGGKKMQDLKVGDSVPENSFTSYESLGQLIARYNRAISAVDPDCQVDTTIRDLRDALAHGRGLMPTLDSDMVLVKFGPAVSGQVLVVFAERLSREWFERYILHVHDEVLKVQEAVRRSFERRGIRPGA
jgi:hypothetical protein